MRPNDSTTDTSSFQAYSNKPVQSADQHSVSQLDAGATGNIVDPPADGPDDIAAVQCGDTGPAVTSLQEHLNAAGYNSGRPNVGVDFEGTDYDAIAAIGKKYGFEWGADFMSFSDRPHFQFTVDFSTSELRARSSNAANPYVVLN